jgi:hypothetical protein
LQIDRDLNDIHIQCTFVSIIDNQGVFLICSTLISHQGVPIILGVFTVHPGTTGWAIERCPKLFEEINQVLDHHEDSPSFECGMVSTKVTD